jgi:hypothetical protein
LKFNLSWNELKKASRSRDPTLVTTIPVVTDGQTGTQTQDAINVQIDDRIVGNHTVVQVEVNPNLRTDLELPMPTTQRPP